MSSTIFQLVSYESGFVSQVGTDRQLENAFAVAVNDVIPLGEWSDYQEVGAFKVRHKGGYQEYKFIGDRPIWVVWENKPQVVAGDFCRITHDSYFSDYLVPESLQGHDLCLYCGHDNGKEGEFRQGWDCYWCGGN